MTSKEFVNALKPLRMDLFVTHNNLPDAMNFANSMIERMSPEDKATAYLVLYSYINTMSKLARECEEETFHHGCAYCGKMITEGTNEAARSILREHHKLCPEFQDYIKELHDNSK